MGNDRRDCGAFYNGTMWSRPLVRVPLTVSISEPGGLERHISPVLITMTSVTKCPLLLLTAQP